MEEFRQLHVALHEKQPKNNPKGNSVLREEDILKTLRSCRETVDRILAKCRGNQRIEQMEYKGVRDLIGAAHIFSSAFHPPSEAVLESCYTLAHGLLIALTDQKVPVESQILFSTALIQILASGPCILPKKNRSDFCQNCSNQNNEAFIEKLAASVRSQEQIKCGLQMESLLSCARKSLLSVLVSSDLWSLPTEKADGFELSLCYALVMSWSRLQNLGASIPLELVASSAVYEIVFTECSKYSKLTTMAFKTLASWLEKVLEFGLCLSAEVIQKVFIIVASSWEIALSGVRKDNARAFSALLSIDSESKSPCLPSATELLDAVVRQLLWTDVSKFYIVTVLIGRLGALKVMEKYADDMTNGLIESFRNNQLAAGGAHLYEALLKQLKCGHWEKFFLSPVLRLISEMDGTDARHLRKIQRDKVAAGISAEKARTIQLNILNYWLRITANIFPDALTILREATFGKLSSAESNSEDHLSFLAAGVLHLSRKKGLWNPLTDPQFKKMATYRDEVTSETYFKSLCISCKISDEIYEEEFQMILEYLKTHVNVDSARTRQEMIKSMTSFFNRFHVSVAHQQKANRGEEDFKVAKNFLDELMAFLSENLTDDSFSGKKISYQRRITSLQIYFELVRSLNGMKNFQQRGGYSSPCAEKIRSWHSSLQQQNMLAGCLDDQTDNIKSTAFSILRERINEVDREGNSWLEAGIQKCQNPIAHVAQSGLFYVLLGSQLLYCRLGKESLIDEKLQRDYSFYKSAYSGSDGLSTPVTLLVFNIGLSNFEHFRSKPMELTKSKSLHGIIDSLTSLVLTPQGPEFGKLDSSFQNKLLNFVEDVASFCVSMFMGSSENKDCAPSFAEMGIAIKNAAKQTTGQPEEDLDDLEGAINTSADERLLVKHLWLNLKACCNFAANVDGSKEVTQKCLSIIIHVLRRCRHKGAIEAAGESLQSLISRISRPPMSSHEGAMSQDTRGLPMAVLKDFLEDLAAGRTANETSITRRSAGLAIFVHHIVIGDADPEKPLLKVAMSHLMSALNTPILDANVNERDLPQAQTLHILRTLVADASLRVTITPYVNSVAQSSLVHLTSSIWSVRNGALQLFGALVPILVGQELALAQFHFHNEKLFESLLSFMESAVSENGLQRHNDAVPAVVLLSRLTAPPALLASQELLQKVQRLKTIFFKLLGSHIMTVRCLAAHGIARMSCVARPSLTLKIIKEWLKENSSQNAIHGSLMAVDSIWERSQCKDISDFHNEICDFIAFLPPHRCKIVSDLIFEITDKIIRTQGHQFCDNHRLGNLLSQLDISSEDNIAHGGAEAYVAYFRSIPSRLELDYTRIAFENAVQEIFKKPALATEFLPAFLSFISNHPTAPSDILINALSAIQQTTDILIKNGSLQSSVADSDITQLYHVSKQWMNPFVKAAVSPVLLGLVHLVRFECSMLDDIIESAILEMKLCCSFAGDRDQQNHLKITEALALLAPILARFSYPSVGRDFIRVTLWFLQSEDTDVRDDAADVVASQRLSHTECLLKLLDPEQVRVYCKDDLTVALSFCDNLLFSDDELLQFLNGMCETSNASVWLRENPYVEDWYIADKAYRQLDALLEEETFSPKELKVIEDALELTELLSFANKCKRFLNFDMKDDSAEKIVSVVKSSSLLQGHRKSAYRARIQEKCRHF